MHVVRTCLGFQPALRRALPYLPVHWAGTGQVFPNLSLLMCKTGAITNNLWESRCMLGCSESQTGGDVFNFPEKHLVNSILSSIFELEPIWIHCRINLEIYSLLILSSLGENKKSVDFFSPIKWQLFMMRSD